MDFVKLGEEVAKVSLGNSRMTDIASGTHTIALETDAKGVDHIYLVSEKKVKTGVTAVALAALRIVEDAAKAVAVKNTRDARESADFSNLQSAMKRETGAIVLSANTKFNCVHRLQIMDNVSGELIFKNDKYKGYPTYVKAARAASAMPSATDDQATAQRNAYTEASEALRASGLKQGVTPTNENLQLLPVFTVTQ